MELQTILLALHVVVTLLMIGFILLQKSSTDGFGLGGGSGAGLMSGRQTANFMTRTTGILAAIFMANSLLLSILAASDRGTSILDEAPTAVIEGQEELGVPLVGDGETATQDVAPVKIKEMPSEPIVPLAE